MFHNCVFLLCSIIKPFCLWHIRFDYRNNGELFTLFDMLELIFLFFSFIEKLSFLFALLCLTVFKPETIGWRIAVRAQVEQKGGWVFISGKRKNLIPVSSLCITHINFKKFEGDKECLRETWLERSLFFKNCKFCWLKCERQ